MTDCEIFDDDALIKALFKKLVKACGGSIACAEYLSTDKRPISDSYVRALYDGSKPDHRPDTRKDIRPLERWIKNPIVTRGLANSTSPDERLTKEEIIELVGAALTAKGARQ